MGGRYTDRHDIHGLPYTKQVPDGGLFAGRVFVPVHVEIARIIVLDYPKPCSFGNRHQAICSRIGNTRYESFMGV